MLALSETQIHWREIIMDRSEIYANRRTRKSVMKWRNAMRRICFCAILPCTIPATLLTAQTIVTGDLTGTVVDETGALLPNSKVTLKSDATGATQTTTTNDAGAFRFTLLRPGTYTVQAESTGFQPTTQRVSISLGQVATTTVQLGIQAQRETVNVTETPSLMQ